MELTDTEFANFKKLLHNMCGLSLGNEKKYLVRQRLEPVAKTHGFKTFSELYFKLNYNKERKLVDDVLSAVTTNETSFFRDGHPFDCLKRDIFPVLEKNLLKKREKAGTTTDKIRIWCAAASSGQEPFTIAMLIHEYCAGRVNLKPEDFKIVATDLSPEILARALKAEYSSIELSRGLSPERKRKFFEQKDTHVWSIKTELQNMIQFRSLNLCQPFTYIGKFDLIFCRNVLIYFDLDTKKKIIEQFLSMLLEQQYLFLGASESLYGTSDKFTLKRFGPTIVYQKA